MLIRGPWERIQRFRHRHGYGMHSPFAYGLLTQVFINSGEFYAFSWLNKLHPWHVRLLRRGQVEDHRRLFRLSNHFQPRLVAAPDGVTPVEWNYLHEGCRKSVINPSMPHSTADMLLLKAPHADWQQHVSQSSILVLTNLTHHADFWQQVLEAPCTRVSFDLGNMGVVFFDPKLQRQNYKL